MFVDQSYLLSFIVLSLHLHQNYKYLSYRYNMFHDDWYKDISYFVGKVKLKFQQNFWSKNTAQTLVELCAIRNGLSTCNALSYLDACELINLISLD